jgi:Family of unknown function (DUF6236)
MAVYYPYIHIRDERWLKVAALYWPHMVRIVSADYPTRNSELVEILASELDFIIDQPPDDAAEHVAVPFARYVDELEPEALQRLRVAQGGELLSPELLALPRPPAAFGSDDSTAGESCVPTFEHYSPRWSSDGTAEDTAGVHRTGIAPSLTRKLISVGLATPARQEWLAMHPELAWVYKCRLTEEFARRNSLVPATDQVPAHAFMGGMADIGSFTGEASKAPAGGGIQAGFGLLSINAVIPRVLDQVPPAQIVEIRSRFASQFDRWGEYADMKGAELASQLQEVDSPSVLKAYLNDAVRKYATEPVDDLRQDLAAAGIETVTTAANTKFSVPSPAITGLTTPQIVTAGGVALAVTGPTPDPAASAPRGPRRLPPERPRGGHAPGTAHRNRRDHEPDGQPPRLSPGLDGGDTESNLPKDGPVLLEVCPQSRRPRSRQSARTLAPTGRWSSCTRNRYVVHARWRWSSSVAVQHAWAFRCTRVQATPPRRWPDY